jgi:hypothetical protein
MFGNCFSPTPKMPGISADHFLFRTSKYNTPELSLTSPANAPLIL